MAFQLSPGVAVVEKDFSGIIPAVATSAGGFAGTFVWGPVLDPVTISSETTLVQRFGKPTDATAQSFFTAANFLAYTNNLLTVRVDTDSYNATASGATGATKIKNEDHYEATASTGQLSVGEWAAKYPGALGNSISVEMADADTWNPIVDDENFVIGKTYVIATEGDTDWNVVAGTVGLTYAVGDSLVAVATDTGSGSAYEAWTYTNEFNSAPGTSSYAASVQFTDPSFAVNDELHIVIIDKDGKWTGVAGAVLEKFSGVSKASDAKNADGSNNYYKDVINSQSKYVWWMDHTTAVEVSGVAWGTAATNNTAYKALTASLSKRLAGGTDDLTATNGQIIEGYMLFANAEQYDISLLPLGKVSHTVAEAVINDVAEVRADCVAFVSPVDTSTGDIIIGSADENITKITQFRDELPSSSYAVMDSGFKYQYDRYNDKYRWVPLNGDTAGLCARTDYTNDPWWSPGGLNRGQVKNVVKLATNPNKTQRDTLYKKGVNPVVNFPGEGAVLFGDKTLLSKPSAFDRINVRRLFIVLEKAIATAAKYQLFEFNDSFTRAQFKNIVEPFLRDVQGRRGVTDFRVKCDDTNNTGEVIDRNEFVADIFIKPNRSINFITLTFVAARSSVNFTEIGA
jgi:phage tail sheath protein FI